MRCQTEEIRELIRALGYFATRLSEVNDPVISALAEELTYIVLRLRHRLEQIEQECQAIRPMP
ncbi:hypothetical protein Pogu_2113 [Pyrobaculum oguniense TE7]|uniref:Uncharacterized protein n=1 Tax=Pyrobaculum oguniense (strain DSM 13380 / JCM 10595 / TE7) TaxID=698757 RepID=H6QCU4_PYROT|nr:hypothetical protein Pogu_2113 [Pyrobaculum oguniense TE7]